MWKYKTSVMFLKLSKFTSITTIFVKEIFCVSNDPGLFDGEI